MDNRHVTVDLAQQAILRRSGAELDPDSVGRGGRPKRKDLQGIALSGLLLVGALVFVSPLAWMLVTAVSPPGQLYSLEPKFLPDSFTFDNFVKGWTVGKFSGHFWNSVLIASMTTIATLFVSSAAGFGFAKFSFKGKELLFLLVLTAIMVPEQVKMVAVARIAASLGWINTFQGVVLPSISQTLGVFLMRQYIASIPDELNEAARLDGASEIQIFSRIILPLARPALAAVAIIQFIWTWNSLLWPLIILRRQAMYTVTVGLAFMSATPEITTEPIMAMALVSTIPVLAVFFALQHHFVRGIALTGLR